MHSSDFSIKNKIIGKDEIFFVIEEGQANLGDFDVAISMINAAATTGADAIEFQLAKADDFYVKSHPGYKIYSKREFSNSQIKELIECAKNNKLEFIAAPLSHKLIEPLVKLGCSAFNINASDLNNPQIIDAVVDTGLPFFLSTPLASENEIEWAVNRIRKNNCECFAILHGQHVMAYNSKNIEVEHTYLGYITFLKKRYNVPVGFIDHTPLGWFSALAVAAGADIVSKHLIISRKNKGPDWQVCLEPKEMKDAITWARKIKKSIKMRPKELAPGENLDRTAMRRSIVASKNLRKGHIVSLKDISFKRPGGGVEPLLSKKVIGRKLLCDIEQDVQIKMEDLGGTSLWIQD